MNDDITSILKTVDPNLVKVTTPDPMLGQVKDFASLVQSAQREGVALWDCSNPNENLKSEAKQAFAGIASQILKLTLGEVTSPGPGR